MKETNGNITLYHGSKSGIRGVIAPASRERCDFGKGFYMGTDERILCRAGERAEGERVLEVHKLKKESEENRSRGIAMADEGRFFDEIVKAGE